MDTTYNFLPLSELQHLGPKLGHFEGFKKITKCQDKPGYELEQKKGQKCSKKGKKYMKITHISHIKVNTRIGIPYLCTI